MVSSSHLRSVKKLLVIKWSALGDAAIATAAFEDIRAAFPDAEIHLNTLPSVAKLLAGDPRFDHVHCIDVRARDGHLARNIQWLRVVRRERYDLVIDLQGSDHSRILLIALALTGHVIPIRAGVRPTFPYNVRASGTHAYRRARSVLEQLGVRAQQVSPKFYPSKDVTASARQKLDDAGIAGRRYALLLPGSQQGGQIKRRGVPRYVEMGVRLVRSNSVDRIAILGGPDEMSDCEQILAGIEQVASGRAVLLRDVRLGEIPDIAASAVCVVANDTGTAHITASSCSSMVVVCGPTDPRRVKPMGRNVAAVQARTDCLSCYRKTCRFGEAAACMQSISTADVMSALGLAPQSCGARVFSDKDIEEDSLFLPA